MYIIKDDTGSMCIDCCVLILTDWGGMLHDVPHILCLKDCHVPKVGQCDL